MIPATVTAPPVAPLETVGDVLELVNDVPPHRIRLRPPPGQATEQDVIECEARYHCLCELVNGVLVEKAMGYYEARLASVLGFFLETYLEGNDRGFAFGGDGMIRVAEGQVRLPDLSFYLWERFPNRLLPPGQILGMVPDLVVEVLSPSNTVREMERKRRECFASGCKQFWEVDPKAIRVRVHSDADHFTEVGEDGTLEGGDLLAGFTLPVRQWFEKAGRRGEAQESV